MSSSPLPPTSTGFWSKSVDNGEGIPRSDWETIFDPYQRGESKNVNPASVGLGLSVSRTLARRMDGDLVYRYEHDESVFTPVLPARTSDGVATATLRTADAVT